MKILLNKKYFDDSLNSVVNLIEHIRIREKQFSYADEDIRKLHFFNIELNAQSTYTNLNTAYHLYLSDQNTQKIARELVGIHNCDEEDRKSTQHAIMVTSKLALLDLSYFQIDYILKRAYEILHKKNAPSSFSHKLGKIAEKTGIAVKSLYVLSYIRNVLHNDGLHSKEDKTISVGKHTFKFKKNTVQGSITHESVADILIDCIKELDSVLRYEEIKKIDLIKSEGIDQEGFVND